MSYCKNEEYRNTELLYTILNNDYIYCKGYTPITHHKSA